MFFDLKINDSYHCPYCNVMIPISADTFVERGVSFENNSEYDYNLETSPTALKVIYIKCPHCKKFIIGLHGIGDMTLGHTAMLMPDSSALQFPDYIPSHIRQDYEEAYKIVNLSPKASATLARRCLQGMIRDFWNIKDKQNLFQEISELQSLVSSSEWKVLDNIRKIGNIGAHPDKNTNINLILDMENHEAEKLLKVIEYFLEKWYVNRFETEKLFSDIEQLKDDKFNKN